LSGTAVPTLAEWLRAEPFALGLSAGFFGFFAHAGVVRALEAEGLWPARAAGSSAGALVAGLWASGRDAAAIGEILRSVRRADFWDPAPGPGLLAGARFRALLERHLAARTFAECRFTLGVSACDLLRLRTRVFDAGPLVPAVHASCAFPFLFQPVWLDGRPHADGGILDRHGLASVPARGRLLYHHLGSRSPWRLPGSRALQVPRRPGTVALVIDGLPRLGPFRLEAGPAALARAHAATRRALELPLRFDARGVARLAV
jgi:NTE family protein